MVVPVFLVTAALGTAPQQPAAPVLKTTPAEAEFSKAVEADPRSAAAYFYLGYTQYKRVEPKRPFHPDKQKAAASFAKAFELEPGFRPVWGPRRK